MTNFNWYFTREEIDNKSPSREDGVTLSTEVRYRKEGARLIINASNTLGLRYETTATGVVFYHRFFMIQSFRQFSRWVVASACLLLAGKVEETPKKCRDIVKVCQSLLTEQQMAHFGSNPKDELTTHERILLQTIKFDLQVEHPYACLLKFAKQLHGDKAKIEKLVQMSWTFVNDSLCTSLCLQWEPQAVAIAFIYLAGKLSKFDLPAATQSKSRSWWRQYLDTLDVHDLESICHQVLDIYGEEEKSGEESGDTTSETTPHSTTPHSTPSTPHPPPQPPPVTSTQLSQQPQPLYPPTPTAPQPPLTVPQQYPMHYQQHPTGAIVPQQHQTRTALYGVPSGSGHSLTPITPTQAIHHVTPPTPPTQPANTPLAFSTLNVNVSGTSPSCTVAGLPPSVQGGQLVATVASASGQYKYVATYPPLGCNTGVRAATSPNLALQQRSYATGANAYPIPNYSKSMSSFIGSGSGQAALTRPVGPSPTPSLMGVGPRGGVIGRGATNTTPPRAPHPVPHVRSNLTPPARYPGPTGVPTPHQPQSGLPVGGVRPPTVGGASSNVAWPR